jgi:hypothetical protein
MGVVQNDGGPENITGPKFKKAFLSLSVYVCVHCNKASSRVEN